MPKEGIFAIVLKGGAVSRGDAIALAEKSGNGEEKL
jgi:MOSC domain-containing protein YiiM